MPVALIARITSSGEGSGTRDACADVSVVSFDRGLEASVALRDEDEDEAEDVRGRELQATSTVSGGRALAWWRTYPETVRPSSPRRRALSDPASASSVVRGAAGVACRVLMAAAA